MTPAEIAKKLTPAQAPDDGVMDMDEAPRRIWVDITLVDSPSKRSGLASNLCTADYSRALPSDTEYVRADILAQTLAANAALEAVVKAGDGLAALVANEEMPDWMVGEGRAAFILRDMGIRKALTTYRAAKETANG